MREAPQQKNAAGNNGEPRAEQHAQVVVASGRDRHARVVERQLRGGDRVHAGPIHPARLHGRDPRRRLECGHLRGQRRAAVGRLEPYERRDTRTAREQGVAKLRVRRAEHRDDAEA